MTCECDDNVINVDRQTKDKTAMIYVNAQSEDVCLF